MMNLLDNIPRSWWRLTEEEADRLNPPFIPGVIEDENGKIYIEYVVSNNWIPLGYIPKPRNEWEWFLHHLFNGLMMRYPWHKVFWFSIMNTNRFRTLEINLRDDLERLERGEEPLYLIKGEWGEIGEDERRWEDGK